MNHRHIVSFIFAATFIPVASHAVIEDDFHQYGKFACRKLEKEAYDAKCSSAFSDCNSQCILPTNEDLDGYTADIQRHEERRIKLLAEFQQLIDDTEQNLVLIKKMADEQMALRGSNGFSDAYNARAAHIELNLRHSKMDEALQELANEVTLSEQIIKLRSILNSTVTTEEKEQAYYNFLTEKNGLRDTLNINDKLKGYLSDINGYKGKFRSMFVMNAMDAKSPYDANKEMKFRLHMLKDSEALLKILTGDNNQPIKIKFSRRTSLDMIAPSFDKRTMTLSIHCKVKRHAVLNAITMNHYGQEYHCSEREDVLRLIDKSL